MHDHPTVSPDPPERGPAGAARPLPTRPVLGWRVWCIVVLPAAVVPAVGIADAALPSGLFDRPLAVLAVFITTGLLIALAALWLARAWTSLRRQVVAHRGLLCPRCRYPLDRLPVSAPCCPECGTIHDRAAIVRLWRDFCRIDPSEAPDPD